MSNIDYLDNLGGYQIYNYKNLTFIRVGKLVSVSSSLIGGSEFPLMNAIPHELLPMSSVSFSANCPSDNGRFTLQKNGNIEYTGSKIDIGQGYALNFIYITK